MSAKGGRVLVVDDDEGHAEALADRLEQDGYDCRIVGSGSAAFAARSLSRLGQLSVAMPVKPNCMKLRRDKGPAQRTIEGG